MSYRSDLKLSLEFHCERSVVFLPQTVQFKRYSNICMIPANPLESVGKGTFMSVLFKGEELVIYQVCNSSEVFSRQCPSLHTKVKASFLIYLV